MWTNELQRVTLHDYICFYSMIKVFLMSFHSGGGLWMYILENSLPTYCVTWLSGSVSFLAGGGGGGGRKPCFHNSSCQMYGCKKSHALVGTNGSDRPCAASTAGWGSPHPALNQTEGKAVKTCTLFLSRWRPVSYPQQRTNVQQWGHSQPQRWLNDLSLSLAFNYFIFL